MNSGKKKNEELVDETDRSKTEQVQVITSLEACKAALKTALFDLGERRKELRCQNMMSEIFADLSLDLDEICVKVAELIPPAWQFPEKTGAMITLEEKVFKTQGYDPESPQLEYDIVADRIIAGKVTISVKQEKSKAATEPFLPEERDLIHSIALRLGNVIALKRREMARDKGEALYHSILSASPDVITITDLNGVIRFSSEQVVKMFGGSNANDFLGQSMFEFIDPSDHQRASDEIAKMMTGQVTGAAEYIAVRKDGSKFDIEVNGEFVRDENRQPVQIIFVIRDITDRKQTENALRESELLYKSLVNTQTNYVLRTDLNGKHTYWNRKFEEEFGWIYSETGIAHADSMHSICEYHHQRTRVAVSECIAIPGKIVKLELDKPAKGGGVRTTLWEFICIADNQGNPSEIQCIGTDIGELKKVENELKTSEQKYKALFEYSPDGYLIFQDGIFVECNKASELLMGGSRSDIIGKRPDEISPEYQPNGKRSFDYVTEVVNKTIVSGRNEFEWTHKKVDGTEFLALIHLAQVQYEGRDALLVSWKDVTALRQTELAIRKSEEKYRLIFETIRDVYYEADLNGTILEMSPSVRSLSKGQFTREELIGKSLFDFYLNPGDRQRFLEKLSEKGTIDDYEVMLRNKDGSNIPVSLSSGFIFGQDGKPLKIAGSVRDITERRLADEEMRKFRTIADKANYGMAIAALDGTMLYTNDYFARMHGWEASEVIGKNLSMFHNEQQMVRVAESIGLLQKEGKFQSQEIWRTRKDGSSFPSLMNAILVYSNEVPQYMSATALDITEIKEKEKEIRKLSLAIEQSPVSIVITDLKANVQYASPAFTSMTGYTFEEVKGKNVNLLKSGKTPDALYRDLWETITAGKPWQGEWVNRRKDGNFYWEQINITPLLDENNEVSGYLAVKMDISESKRAEQEIMELNASLEQKIVERTAELAIANEGLVREIEERKQIEEEIKKARQEAEEANQAKSEFLSRMSHELRTPMNSILGFAQLLERGDLNPGQKKGVSHILRSGKHLLELINEVLDISRIEAGRISFSPEPVQLHGVIIEMTDTVQPQVNARQITLDVIQSDAMQLSVKSDRQRLKQILLNLISNAIKYNKEGGSIRINAELLPRNSQGWVPVRISVKDTGRGINAEDLGKLFVPFERIGAENTETEGTGLGLAVVKKLIDLMGGEIGVESTPGVGSNFWIELPLTESQLEPLKNLSLIHDSEKVGDSWAGTILYVEDNRPNIDLVSEIIDSARPGIRLITTTYGKKALGLALENNPDLILLDLNLPDIHGSEVLRMLKANENTKRIPVVVVTADAVPDHLRPLLKEGAMDCLIKPLEIDNFLHILDKIFS